MKPTATTVRAIRRIFAITRNDFAESYPHLHGSALTISKRRCSPGSPCGKRDIAWCDTATKRVYIRESALPMPSDNLIAIIRHELAHIAEPYASEREADSIASRVFGETIRYDKNDIQTLGRGTTPRPARLPK